MTDITELAQRLKAAAEKATQGNWRAFQYHDGRCGIGGGHNAEIMVCEHISKERPHDAMFIALANPANVLALVEALEKAQRANAAQDDHINQQQDRIEQLEEGARQINSWRRLAKQNIAEREKDIAELEAARQRIADLESRTVTVKMPLPSRKTADDYVDDTFEPCDLAAVYNACRLECEVKFKNALTAAGIKAEAE